MKENPKTVQRVSRFDWPSAVRFTASWLQPLLHGSAFILTEIPIDVAVLTHVSYGLTVALVTYVLQRDFMYPSQQMHKRGNVPPVARITAAG